MFPELAWASFGLIVVATSVALRRTFWLLRVEAPRAAWRSRGFGARCRRLWQEGFLQQRLRQDPWPGWAHLGLFFGFWVLLPRTTALLGRAFRPSFGRCGAADGLGLWGVTCDAYVWPRMAAALLVLLGTATLAFRRSVLRTQRLRPSAVANLILFGIITMMLSDFLYEGAGSRLAASWPLGESAASGSLAERLVAPFVAGATRATPAVDPVTRLVATALRGVSRETLVVVGLASYLLHVVPVLLLLLAIPHSKHFHLLTAWPNLFFDRMEPQGKLSAVAPNAAQLLERVEASLLDEARGPSRRAPLGKAALRDFSVFDRLSWFACTECGRCTSHCPAALSGRPLDPRQWTLDLRDRLKQVPRPPDAAKAYLAEPLVPSVIAADAVWACTNCGACEEQCPVGVRYVDTVAELRRDLLLMRGEAPPTLQRLFEGLERQQNPWNLPRRERAAWAEGLAVERLEQVRHVEYLYWVGCAASYDGGAQSVARAMVSVMRKAGVSFAILGAEERCTGDAARRAGNELLYLQLAEQNVALLNRYQAEGRFERIIATCPHCISTLAHDYPELGGHYDVVAHGVAIERWLTTGRLAPSAGDAVTVTYHDPCTLARSCGVTEAPRHILAQLPQVQHVEPAQRGRHTACCGAGGAGMWLETADVTRPAQLRVSALARPGVESILTACPFCKTMLNDAAQGSSSQPPPRVRDIAEIVDERSHGGAGS